MLPDPLHPAIVHFPIVLAVVLPVVALIALVAIRRGARASRAWTVPLLVALALVVSAWVAIRTGEAEEERVEAVVSESVLHDHEEAAERFLALSGIVLIVAAAGLLRGAIGTSARLVATVGMFGLVIAGFDVGRAGGELVYHHGAAAAYAQAGAAGVAGARLEAAARDDEREDR